MKKILLFLVALAAAFSFCTACTEGSGGQTISGNSEAPVVADPSDTISEIVEKPPVETMPSFEPEHLIQISTQTTSPIKSDTATADVPKEPVASEEDIELLAVLTMAEAEGEPEYGQRLVIDAVLNRMDLGKEFPNNIHDVIYQKYHFSSVWNGRMDRCYVEDNFVQLVREELENRTNYDVIFFNAGDYSQYGTPMFQVGNHYFSSYN